jgi:hypothetical protein
VASNSEDHVDLVLVVGVDLDIDGDGDLNVHGYALTPARAAVAAKLLIRVLTSSQR